MSDLSTEDVRAVLDLVAEVHHAEDVRTFREQVLPSIRTVVPADYASYNEVWMDGGVGTTIVSPELPQWAYEAWARHAHQNPLVQRYQQSLDGRAYRFSDVVEAASLRRLDLYRELYEPLGVDHQIAVAMPAPPTLVIGVALSRGGSDFTERDRAILNLVRPHLIQAYRNVELRERLRGLVGALTHGLDDSGESLIVIDAEGRVEFLNEGGAAAVAAATGGPAEAGSTLPPPLGPWVADGAEGDGPLFVDGGGRRYVVRCLRPDGNGDLRVLLFQAASRAVSREVLEGLGLTAREAEVLQGMMRGLATVEIGARMEISRATVYKHAERIFTKLGVHDRIEAVAVAWAAVGGDHR